MNPAASEAAIIAAMPRTARELVDVIGFLPALAVLRSFGGKRLYVPQSLASNAGRRLAAKVGSDATQSLIVACAGREFDVPLMQSVERLLRNNALRHDFEVGTSMGALVDKYRVGSRQIFRILGEGGSF